MAGLEQAIDNFTAGIVNERFRLCLATMSSSHFPIGIRYQGVQLMDEILKTIS
jgi:hypothetical protein